ncbi:MAG: RHS repeat-associated core domain-containing protein [Planctomycetota bacterium]
MALSDGDGDTVQTYEYSVYGEVAVEDANHTNPYMFAGRRFDIEIGLYYNRARYYNPYTGRFLQTDPIGYGDGLNWYRYCRNNPLNGTDPSGMSTLHTPPGMAVLIASEGLGAATAMYGRSAVINYIIQTAGQSIAVSGMMVKVLPGLDWDWHADSNTNSDPNVDPNSTLKCLHSFEEIMDDPDMFEYWAKRDSFPLDRPYNEYEALRIVQNYEEYFGEPPVIHKGPHGQWDEHVKPPNKPGVHTPITKEALELLEKLGYEIIY